MSRGCHHTIQYEKHVNLSCGKAKNSLHVQNNITKFYSKLLLEIEIQKSKSIGRDPRHGPLPYIWLFTRCTSDI